MPNRICSVINIVVFSGVVVAGSIGQVPKSAVNPPPDESKIPEIKGNLIGSIIEEGIERASKELEFGDGLETALLLAYFDRVDHPEADLAGSIILFRPGNTTRVSRMCETTFANGSTLRFSRLRTGNVKLPVATITMVTPSKGLPRVRQFILYYDDKGKWREEPIGPHDKAGDKPKG